MKRTFRAKRLADGRAMLNIGCGGRMHPEWNNVDFSPLVRLGRYPRVARVLNAARILSRKRYERLLRTDPNIICWDLRKGIPFESDTFDVVYHSHFLEHLDRRDAPGFLEECRRVLRPNGIIRVVVPDLQVLCRRCVNSYTRLEQSGTPSDELVRQHQEAVAVMIRQMVVATPYGTTEQRYPVRLIERWLRGDNVRAGEIHRWMYDGHTLGSLLRECGFREIDVASPASGRISGWSDFRLDTEEDGVIYMANSIYVEAVK
jgi:predicted SAM-dependent methyltransferase